MSRLERFHFNTVYTFNLHCIPNKCQLLFIVVKKTVEAMEGEGERVGVGEREMGDSDSSDDSDMIGPPLPPGYSAGKRGDSAGVGTSRESRGDEREEEGDEGESEEEEGEDESVSVLQDYQKRLLIILLHCEEKVSVHL